MVTVCWSVKGGSGVTVTCTALALLRARAWSRSVLLVDLSGDGALVLGCDAAVEGAGVHDWLNADSSVAPSSLEQLIITGPKGLRILPAGRSRCTAPPPARLAALAGWLVGRSDHVIIDLGTNLALRRALLACADESLLVLPLCYLAGRAAITAERPSGLIIVEEPDRTLTCHDLVGALGVPIVARVPHEPAVAKSVDTATLATRMPRVLGRALRSLTIEPVDVDRQVA